MFFPNGTPSYIANNMCGECPLFFKIANHLAEGGIDLYKICYSQVGKNICSPERPEKYDVIVGELQPQAQDRAPASGTTAQRHL